MLQQQMQPQQNPLGSSAPPMEQLLAARAAASGLGPVSAVSTAQLLQPSPTQGFELNATQDLVQAVVRQTTPAAAAAAAAVCGGSSLGARSQQKAFGQSRVCGLMLQQQYVHQEGQQQQQQQYICQEGQQHGHYMHQEGQPQRQYMQQQLTAGPAAEIPVAHCSVLPPTAASNRNVTHSHCSRLEGGHMLPPAAKRLRRLPPCTPSAPAIVQAQGRAGRRMVSQGMGDCVAQLVLHRPLASGPSAPLPGSVAAAAAGARGIAAAPTSAAAAGAGGIAAAPVSGATAGAGGIAAAPISAAAAGAGGVAGAGSGFAIVRAERGGLAACSSAPAWQSGPLPSCYQIAEVGGEPAERTALRSQLRSLSDDQLWGVAASVIAECKRLGPPGCCC